MTPSILAVAGSIGALARYLISGAMQRLTGSAMPVGTATVNLIGAFILGICLGAGDGSLLWTAAAGFSGGLTTFSTWMVETRALGMNPRPSPQAVLNLTMMAVLGVALAAAGYQMTR